MKVPYLDLKAQYDSMKDEIAAAHELRLRGYEVTVYDAGAEPGGLLLHGVPRYRLPIDVLRRDIERIRAIGVRFELGRRLGEDLDLETLVESHAAVCLAIGAELSRRIDLDGVGWLAAQVPAGPVDAGLVRALDAPYRLARVVAHRQEDPGRGLQRLVA